MGINHEDLKVQRGDQEDTGFLRNEATNADGMPVCRGVWKTGPVQPLGIHSHIEVEWLLLIRQDVSRQGPAPPCPVLSGLGNCSLMRVESVAR